MEKIKTIVVSISDLKITSEDPWLDKWIADCGDSVARSPQCHALRFHFAPFLAWFDDVLLLKHHDMYDRIKRLFDVYVSLRDEGQKEPIRIYSDMRIVSGHKRAAALHVLGKKFIKAQIVPDGTKL